MTHKNARTIVQGAINLTMEVTLVPPKGTEDTTGLRLALAEVDRYKREALKALKLNEKDADWMMVEYAVKNDCVVVTVKQGACG